MESHTPVRTRFAPSPTGAPHIGNIRTALFAWLFARSRQGQFILRIEDTDRSRYVEGSIDQIQRSLEWLGIDWDEGPVYQSQRLPLYQDACAALVDRGCAYRCFCTPERLEALRAEQEQAKRPTGYDRRCRLMDRAESDARAAAGEPHVIRFAMPLEGQTAFRDAIRADVVFDNALQDDFVLLKTDGFPTYHLASVVDDHDMAITHVIRGEEWISSTPKHVLLYQAMGWTHPVFAHLPVILGSDRKKLSKRHGSVQFTDYIDQGYLSDAMFNFLALLGWSPGDDRDLYDRAEVLNRFGLEDIVDHAAIFDADKLLWYNARYIQMTPSDQLCALCEPYLRLHGFDLSNHAYLAAALELLRDRLKRLDEVADAARPFYVDPNTYDEKGRRKWFEHPAAVSLMGALVSRCEVLSTNPDLSGWETLVRGAAQDLSLPEPQAIHTTRLAVSGRTTGPGLFEMLVLLGPDTVLRRLRRALAALSATG